MVAGLLAGDEDAEARDEVLVTSRCAFTPTVAEADEAAEEQVAQPRAVPAAGDVLCAADRILRHRSLWPDIHVKQLADDGCADASMLRQPHASQGVLGATDEVVVGPRHSIAEIRAGSSHIVPEAYVTREFEHRAVVEWVP